MTSPNTPVDVERLEGVARAATPGTWAEWSGGQIVNPGRRKVAKVSIAGKDSQQYEADIAFIATFDPPTVLRLLAERREMLEALVEWIALKDLLGADSFDGIEPAYVARLDAIASRSRIIILSALPEGKGE